jgi:hypothetical protein
MSKHAGGRPTKYEDEYAEQAYKLCLLGATDADLADFFAVNETRLTDGRSSRSFRSLKRGKARADANVAHSLYQRAIGYSHDDIDIRAVDKDIVETPITKHHPPDTNFKRLQHSLAVAALAANVRIWRLAALRAKDRIGGRSLSSMPRR